MEEFKKSLKKKPEYYLPVLDYLEAGTKNFGGIADRTWLTVDEVAARVKRDGMERVSFALGNGVTVKGEFIGSRIAIDTLPKGKRWYEVRHADDDGSEPASLKGGRVMVNFLGTFICDPIKGMGDGDEVEITAWEQDEDMSN